MSYQKLKQEDRIIELLKDKELITPKQIREWTDYNISSIKRTLKEGVKKGLFVEKNTQRGCYKLK